MKRRKLLQKLSVLGIAFLKTNHRLDVDKCKMVNALSSVRKLQISTEDVSKLVSFGVDVQWLLALDHIVIEHCDKSFGLEAQRDHFFILKQFYEGETEIAVFHEKTFVHLKPPSELILWDFWLQIAWSHSALLLREGERHVVSQEWLLRWMQQNCEKSKFLTPIVTFVASGKSNCEVLIIENENLQKIDCHVMWEFCHFKYVQFSRDEVKMCLWGQLLSNKREWKEVPVAKKEVVRSFYHTIGDSGAKTKIEEKIAEIKLPQKPWNVDF